MTVQAKITAIHSIVIPDWRPALLNELMRSHWSKVGRLKRRDREMVAAYSRLANVPPARGPRRVGLIIGGNRYPERAPDPDGVWKSLLDALVHARMLIDDSAEWCELKRPVFHRRPEGFRTVITLEDVD